MTLLLFKVSTLRGIVRGSFTASQAVGFTAMKNLGYVGAVYGAIATVLVLILHRQYQGMKEF